MPPHGSNRKVLFDFTGTGPQVKGNINSTVTATLAGVLYSLKALLDPDVPNNQGLIEIVDIDRAARLAAQCEIPGGGRGARQHVRSASSTW